MSQIIYVAFETLHGENTVWFVVTNHVVDLKGTSGSLTTCGFHQYAVLGRRLPM